MQGVGEEGGGRSGEESRDKDRAGGEGIGDRVGHRAQGEGGTAFLSPLPTPTAADKVQRCLLDYTVRQRGPVQVEAFDDPNTGSAAGGVGDMVAVAAVAAAGGGGAPVSRREYSRSALDEDGGLEARV
ncbi:unnamed protein product, partial [Discosporangium mesarthrocarpum]